jgi:Ca2+-binding EF-hand superfamily protein
MPLEFKNVWVTKHTIGIAYTAEMPCSYIRVTLIEQFKFFDKEREAKISFKEVTTIKQMN